MRKEDCFYLGHISRKHGYKGEVIAVFDTDQKENYTALESVLLDIHGELIPFFIEEMAMNSKGHFILGLEDDWHLYGHHRPVRTTYFPDR